MANLETGPGFNPEETMVPKIAQDKKPVIDDNNEGIINKIKGKFKKETPLNRETHTKAELKAKQAKTIAESKETSAHNRAEQLKKGNWKEYTEKVDEILYKKIRKEFEEKYGDDEELVSSKIETAVNYKNSPDKNIIKKYLEEIRTLGNLDEEGKSYVDYEFEAAIAERELKDLMARGHVEANVLNEKYTILLKCLEAQEKSLDNYVPGSPEKEKAVRKYEKLKEKIEKYKRKNLK